MNDQQRPNCYECAFRREIPGSTHSLCAHPDTAETRDNPAAQIIGMLATGMPIPSKAWGTLKIVGHSHGIRMGWFAWPLNFDPVWLKHCEGFQQKELDNVVL